MMVERGYKLVTAADEVENPSRLSCFIKTVFFTEIVRGMALTLKTMFTKPVTRQYPKEKCEPMAGFRGLHALAKTAEGKMKCVGCGLCAAMCPSRCINIYTTEGPDHNKVVDRYEIEVLKCVFCAFCVEACPYGAIVLTPHFEYSGFTREEFLMTKEKLLDNWDKYMAGEKGERYFERFWNPREGHFIAHEGQAVFKGKKSL
jgi:NADH-quinone oxidoreductase subunit I